MHLDYPAVTLTAGAYRHRHLERTALKVTRLDQDMRFSQARAALGGA